MDNNENVAKCQAVLSMAKNGIPFTKQLLELAELGLYGYLNERGMSMVDEAYENAMANSCEQDDDWLER